MIKCLSTEYRSGRRGKYLALGHGALPCEQLVSPTLPERETTASNRLILHRASHVMYLTSLCLISQEISTQQAHPNADVT